VLASVLLFFSRVYSVIVQKPDMRDPSLFTLEDLKRRMGIPLEDTSRDTLLRQFIKAASLGVEQ